MSRTPTNEVGRAIRGRRRREGMTLERLSQLAHVSTSKLSEFESGMRIPPDAPLARIAAALGIDFERLVEVRRLPTALRELERARQAIDRASEVLRRPPVVAKELDPRQHGALKRVRRARPALAIVPGSQSSAK